MVVGWVVVLNGPPRSGKSSIARAMAEAQPGVWINHGVDASMAATPQESQPGVGLRPGGERPDLEPRVEELYTELWRRVAALAEAGGHVVVDVGLHTDFAGDLDPWAIARRELAGLEVLVVGVRCSMAEVLARRAASTGYAVGEAGEVPTPVRRWEAAVHDPGHYDLEVDTTSSSPAQCAATILARLATGRPGRALHTHPT